VVSHRPDRPTADPSRRWVNESMNSGTKNWIINISCTFACTCSVRFEQYRIRYTIVLHIIYSTLRVSKNIICQSSSSI
jgi:hypothetical protein